MSVSRKNRGARGDLQTALRHAAALLGRDPAAAAAQARLILTVVPGEPNAGVLLARAERCSGRPQQAVDAAAAVVDQHSANAFALEELGLSLLAAGRWVEAEDALAKAVAINEHLPDAWMALGDIRAACGDGRGSNEAFQKHTSSAGGNLELIRAADALLADDLALAERLCRDVLTRNPQSVAAIRLLAEVGVRLGRFDEAEELLAYCLDLAPDFLLARRSYAHLRLRQLRYRDALTELQKVLSAEPNRPSHLLLKASILAQIGETDGAIEIYDALLKEYPGHAQLHLNRGHALKTVGKRAEAVTAYRTAIGIEPDLGEAYWSLSNLKTFEFDDADIRGMRDRLERTVTTPEDFFHLSFALGKALEDKGEFDESYRHYSNANAARRRTVHWDADVHHAEIERIAAFFRPEFFDARQQSSNPTPTPIFIVGMPRAGSTLLEQILASHSEVEGTMELFDIMAIARRLSTTRARDQKSAYPEALSMLTPIDLEALGRLYLERTAILRSDAPYFIDKMPNNFAYVGLIHSILPKAKILDARRHPMACCFSVFKQLFAHGQTFSYTLEEIGRYYRDYVELMSHWDAVLPGRVLRVDYEAVVENTEEQVRRVLDHCGLEFEPACLEFYRTERTVRTASSEQVRQPIYRNAVDQWRNYEAHLGPLRESLERSIRI